MRTPVSPDRRGRATAQAPAPARLGNPTSDHLAHAAPRGASGSRPLGHGSCLAPTSDVHSTEHSARPASTGRGPLLRRDDSASSRTPLTRRPGVGALSNASLCLGALAGLRTTAAPAVLAFEGAREGAPPGGPWYQRWAASPFAPAAVSLLMLGELTADKLPFVGSRLAPLPLIGRLASGAFSAASLAKRWNRPAAGPAAAAAIGALAGAFVGHGLRARLASRLRLSSAALGFAEDFVVLAGAGLLGRFLRRTAPPIYRGGGR